MATQLPVTGDSPHHLPTEAGRAAASLPDRALPRTRRRCRRTVVAVLAGVLLALSLAGPASAASYTITNTGGDSVKMRDNPTGGSTWSGLAAPGSSFSVVCQQWGEPQGTRGNTLWFKVNGSGRNGWWVNDTWTSSPHLAADKTNGVAGIPWCQATTTPPPSGTYISRAAPLHLCTDTANAGCRPTGMPSVAANQKVSMVCWKKGSWFTGDYGTDMWFWVTGPAGEGYVSASVVRNQTSVGACTARPAFVAAEAAAARYGQATASAADQALFAASEWAPGPVGEWAGDCPKLPYVAWKAAGVAVARGNAINNYEYYRSRSLIRTGVPPRGAVVFYAKSVAPPYGHTAISLGNGFVATTRGLDFSGQKNATVRYDSYGSGTYLGYYLP